MPLNIIAAIGKNNELGKDNDLIWKISDDLKFFKEKTISKYIIMGRKTFESLPTLLKGRKHIVLTRNEEIIPGVAVYSNVQEIIEKFKTKEAYIIGGASIYKEFIDYVAKMYLTLIDDECKEADAYFPNFNEEDFDKEILDIRHDEKLGINYKHVLYKRR